MHFSQFAAYINQNAKFIPAALLREVKEEAKARLVARLQAGRADCELTFTDLVAKCEAKVCGA